MNREIKFRAWLKDEEKIIDVKAIDFDDDGNVFSINYPEGKSYSGYDRDNIELMQYTNLKDKNGVEIYEGDIVKTVGYHHLTPHKIEETLFVVVWSFTRWVLQKKLKTGGVEETLLGDEDDEVIGNIYQDKELLENE